MFQLTCKHTDLHRLAAFFILCSEALFVSFTPPDQNSQSWRGGVEARRVLPDAQNNRVASMVTGSWGRVDKNAEANCSPDKHNPFPLAKNPTNTVFALYDLKKRLQDSKATLILASMLPFWHHKGVDNWKDATEWKTPGLMAAGMDLTDDY